MKKPFAFLCFLYIFFITGSFLSACGQKTSTNKWKIGVSMPNAALERWNKDGQHVKELLKESGFDVTLQYAEGSLTIQLNQLENMVSNGCKVLVIAPVDSKSMTNILEKAHNQGVKIIAYDRLITGGAPVDYYTTFDNIKVGRMEASYIVDKLNLAESKDSHYVELVLGDQADENSRALYTGVMERLKPFLDNKKLIIKSKQINFENVVTPGWETAKAQSRMDNILVSEYSNGAKLDAVVAISDCLSLGVINSLMSIYGNDITKFPIITGQDCDKANVVAIKEGKQSFSIFKDTRKLGKTVQYIVDSLYNNNEIEVNDRENYKNGENIIPTITHDPIFVDKDNYKAQLIDSGYYKESDLN